jgi:hypothetical protein
MASCSLQNLSCLEMKCGGLKCLCSSASQTSMPQTTHFVEVNDEPYHIQSFQNDHVRVFRARIPPGCTTLYHRHSINTCYVALESAENMTNCELNHSTETMSASSNQILSSTYITEKGERTSYVHALHNPQENNTTNFLGIEVRSMLSPTQLSKTIPLCLHYSLLSHLQTPSFIPFLFTLPPHEITPHHSFPERGIAVLLNGTPEKWFTLPTSPLTKLTTSERGEYVYFDMEMEEFVVENTDNENLQILILFF